MTQPLEAVGGSNDTVVAAEPTIEDRFAAFTDDQQDEELPPAEEAPEGDLHPDDAAALETEAAELEAEPDDLPPIEPPVSLTAEEKEAFKGLPREAQEFTARRIGELEKGLHTKAQEAKTAQQKVEQEARERIAQVQNVHVQALQALLPEIPARPDPRMQINDQVGYANQLAQHEWAVAQHQQAQQLIQHVSAQQEAAERAAAQQEAKDNEDTLRDKFPEYFSEKGPELERTLRSTAVELGYSDDQLAHVNATDVLAMKKAHEWREDSVKYRALMAKQMARVRDGKKLPAISRPGTPQGKGVAANQRYEADRQAMRGGDKDAAVRVFSKFL
jgi:hypothetical protein